MRKALIGLLIGATAATPLASASAQDWRGRGEARAERQHGHSDRGQQRNERQMQRFERQQARVERQQPRVERQERFERQQPRFERSVRNDGPQTRQRVRSFEGNTERVRRDMARPQMQVVQNRDWQDRSRNDDRVRSQTRRWDGQRDRQWDGRSDYRRDGNWNRNRSSRNWSRDWNHNWRNDRRYDWQRYRYSNRSLFHGRRYYAPYRGWNYRRFSVGFFLEPLFYSSNYWISDPWQYRLPPAYPGTRWVRYYDDVLLVDMYSGEVIDVIYNFFW